MGGALRVSHVGRKEVMLKGIDESPLGITNYEEEERENG
jgi:hypothetical protein